MALKLISLAQSGQEVAIAKLTAETPQPNLVSLPVFTLTQMETCLLTEVWCDCTLATLERLFNPIYGVEWDYRTALCLSVHLSDHHYTCCPHRDDVQWPWPGSIPQRSRSLNTLKVIVHVIVKAVTCNIYLYIDGLPYNSKLDTNSFIRSIYHYICMLIP